MDKYEDEELIVLPIIAIVVFTAAFGAMVAFLAWASYKLVVLLLAAGGLING